jgi:hypothetical protein
MSTVTDTLCSRCGTPFPRERGKVPVNCVVCGQLRPDLDMTLDDDAGASARAVPASPATMSQDHLRPASPVKDEMPAPAERRYVSMSDSMELAPVVRYKETFTDVVGQVLLVACPALAAMAGALAMLNAVPNFARGSWYAVAAVSFITLAMSVGGGLVLAGLPYLCRLRMKVVIRILFALGALAAIYACVTQIPPRVDVRPDALPAVRL